MAFNGEFHEIDMKHWERKNEFEFFSQGGCGFNVTAEIDVTNLYECAHRRKIKFYPLLAAVAAQILNRHEEFRHGWQKGRFGYYSVVHPVIYDLIPGGNVKRLCAEYCPDVFAQVDEIERVRAQYHDENKFMPQADFPDNSVNISCMPWVDTKDISFCLQYCATLYHPIITFGKYFWRNERLVLPMSVYCNHAVNDGWHCSRFIGEFQALASFVK